jgi:hypothetical protein
VAVAGVAVQDALGDDPVDGALRCEQRLGRGVLVAGGDGLLHVLDRGAHRGAHAEVVAAAHDGLPGALAD